MMVIPELQQPVTNWHAMRPDHEYNFQDWKIGGWEYSPVFIDLIDDFNQRKYYKAYAFTHNGTDRSGNYPEDYISGVPIAEIERMVFASRTLDSFKTKLKQYATANPNIARGLTERNINTLFECYE